MDAGVSPLWGSLPGARAAEGSLAQLSLQKQRRVECL